jgi:hypothetical protein
MAGLGRRASLMKKSGSVNSTRTHALPVNWRRLASASPSLPRFHQSRNCSPAKRGPSMKASQSRGRALDRDLTGHRLFPFPAHQTGRVHFEHPAFRLASPQHPRERSPRMVPGDGTEDFSLRTATQQDRKVISITRCCRLIVNHRSVSSFPSTPEARVLPSAGITRHLRYRDPLRLPGWPPSFR